MHVVVFVANNCRLGGIGCIAADRGWGGGVCTVYSVHVHIVANSW